MGREATARGKLRAVPPGMRVLAPVLRMDLRVVILDQVRRIYESFTTAAREFTVARRGQLPCVEHCGLCCLHNTPVVTEPEAAYVISHLNRISPPLQKRIWNQLESWLTTPAPAGRWEGATTQVGAEANAISRQACPFLGTGAEGFPCLVHEYRPMSCRAYSVTVGPQTFCKRPKLPYENSTHWMALVDGPTVDGLRAQVRQLYQDIRTSPAGMRVGLFPYLVARMWRPAEVQKLPVPEARALLSPQPHAVLFEEDAERAGWRGSVPSLALAESLNPGVYEDRALAPALR